MTTMETYTKIQLIRPETTTTTTSFLRTKCLFKSKTTHTQKNKQAKTKHFQFSEIVQNPFLQGLSLFGYYKLELDKSRT